MLSLILSAALAVTGDDIALKCSVLDQLALAEERLSETRLKIWDRDSKDPMREVALALLMPDCSIQIVSVIKQKKDLVIPDESSGYDIEIVPRLRATWNFTSTQFKVIRPQGATVVLVKYPLVAKIKSIRRGKTSSGKSWKKTVTHTEVKEVIGAPYNRDLRVPEVLARAKTHLNSIVDKAFDDLTARGLRYPEITPDFIKALPLLEQSDPDECLADCLMTYEMVLVRIGIDLERAFSQTISKAAARGLMQYTKRTYDDMRHWAPRAGLEPDFALAVKDHVNITKAAIILHAYNLKQLREAFGNSISDDPFLEEYLVAAYNGGIGRVILTIKVAQRQGKSDWIDGSLRAKRRGRWRTLTIVYETKNYVYKLRALRDLNII